MANLFTNAFTTRLKVTKCPLIMYVVSGKKYFVTNFPRKKGGGQK